MWNKILHNRGIDNEDDEGLIRIHLSQMRLSSVSVSLPDTEVVSMKTAAMLVSSEGKFVGVQERIAQVQQGIALPMGTPDKGSVNKRIVVLA